MKATISPWITTAPSEEIVAKPAIVTGHWPELSGIRAVCILFVLGIHASYGAIKGGFLGVDIFFVLSGFLITRLLVLEKQRNGRISLTAFYVRRAARILPPVFILLVISAALWKRTTSSDVSLSFAAWRVVLFCSNFVSTKALGFLAHTWSLSIEEQFYLVWPAVLVVCMRFNNLAALATAFIGILAGLSFRMWSRSQGMDPEHLYTHTFARIDSLFVGCIIALAYNPIVALLKRWKPGILFGLTFCTAIVCMFTLPREAMLRNYWTFTAFAVLSALIIVLCISVEAGHPIRRMLRARPIVYLGCISYGVYLYHYPIFAWLEQFRVPGDLLNFSVVLVAKVFVSLVVSSVSWHLIEIPIRDAGRRLVMASVRSYVSR